MTRPAGSSTKFESPRPQPGSPAAELAAKRGLRIRPYRPMRALVGAMIVIAAVVAALAIYTRVGNRVEVLAVRRFILAGEQLLDGDLHIVSVSSDDSFPSIPATDRALVVGQYAKVRLAAGSLLVTDSIQAEQLVNPARVLMSVVVPVGLVPVGLREQSRLTLVVTPPATASTRVAPVLVEAVVAAIPRNLAEVVGTDDSGRAMVALSVEVDPRWVSVVGSASAVSVGVLDPRAPFPDVAGQLGLTPTSTSAPSPVTAAPVTVPGVELYGSTTLPGTTTSTTPVPIAEPVVQPTQPVGI